MYNKTCCFTGHRIIPKEKEAIIQNRLENMIIDLIFQGVQYFCAGGALGFDTMAAQTVLRVKLELQQIRLILALPCKEQTYRWNEKDIEIYNQILSEADKVVYTSEHYYKGCMHKRNRYLVDNSGICLCYLTESTGGTAYTVDYARKKGLQIKNLAEKSSPFANDGHLID